MYLNIALAKGRIQEQSYAILKDVGYECLELEKGSRKLILENKEKKLRYFLVKPSDVAIYVETGAADLGIVGKDILLEDGNDVFEMLDLGFGKCYFAVAGPSGFDISKQNVIRVATKYPNLALSYLSQYDVDIIKLNGSIELAPLINMADVILDIVETGNTLRDNDLVVINKYDDISARLIVNKASYRFKYKQINKLIDDIKEVL
ncbi:MAG: ATP phosphoribosyltransferase [Bacilli bacterium]